MNSQKTLKEQSKTVKPEEVIEPQPTSSRLPRLTIVVIIFIIIVAGYFILSSRNQKQTASVFPSQTPTVIPTIDSRINWKTYTNTDLGFSIQYPEDYLYEEIDAGVTHSPYTSYSLIDLQGNGNKIEIAVAENDNNYSLDKIIGNGPLLSYSKDILDNENVNNIEVDGVEALRIDNIPVGLAGIRSEILFIKKNKIYQIILVPSEAKVDIFNQILSTFQFLDQEQDSTIWVRKQFGEAWDIEYPERWSVNEAGLIEGNIILSGIYNNTSYAINLGYPIGLGYIDGPPQNLTLEQWVNHELSFLPTSQRETIQIKDSIVTNTPGKKVLNIAEVTYDDGVTRQYSNNFTHQVYIWLEGNKNQRIVTLKQTSGVFDPQTAEQLLDRFIQGIN
ncbi:hypothetical protein HYT02_06045 [Candidatus Gottesmanbacteria bacterium]|nr:hypothetical protein [Candidatus Gottesmanbacteria bacterium]